MYNSKDTNRRSGCHIEEFNFDQMVSSLGDMRPESAKIAREVFDALIDMAWSAEAAIEDVSVVKIADEMRISFHIDGMSACEKNFAQVCIALSNASALRLYMHDADTFCLEVSIPCVFAETGNSPKMSTLIVADERDTSDDTTLPDWLYNAAKAVKKERDTFSSEDFNANYEQMQKLAEVYAAVKQLSNYTDSIFEFTKPEPPGNMHGGTHIKRLGSVVIEKENLAALVEIIKLSRAFNISSTNDGYVYLSFWVNNIYLNKE